MAKRDKFATPPDYILSTLTDVATELGYVVLIGKTPEEHRANTRAGTMKVTWISQDLTLDERVSALTHEVFHMMLPVTDSMPEEFVEIACTCGTYAVLLAWGYDDSHLTNFLLKQWTARIIANYHSSRFQIIQALPLQTFVAICKAVAITIVRTVSAGGVTNRFEEYIYTALSGVYKTIEDETRD